MVTINQHTTKSNEIPKDFYRIDLFFLKKGEMLLIKRSNQYSLPHRLSDWSISPEEEAILFAREELGIQIDQFDYPLGYKHDSHEGREITTYALVPAMWRESALPKDSIWCSPLRTPANTSENSKEVMRHFFRRVEEELIYGNFTE